MRSTLQPLSLRWLSGLLICVLLMVLPGYCHPGIQGSAKGGKGGSGSGSGSLDSPVDITDLLKAEKAFKSQLEAIHPGFLKQHAASQKPPFMLIGCSDSRTSEGTLFHTEPGVLFAARNIAAQYYESDTNVNAVLTYATLHLGVHHIIVLGHYGCGGVAAAITTPLNSEKDAQDAVQKWIWPIRQIYLTSTRSEIAALRTKNKSAKTVPTPELHDTGYRALIEENVKANVNRIAKSEVASKYTKSGGKVKIVIHGWVYDIESGEIKDLKVDLGFGK